MRWWACVLVVVAGCYDDHGRFDTGVDAFTTPDAAPMRDAWGDANADAGPGPCFIEGRAIAGLPESRGDRVGCACPSGTVAGIAFRPPAPLPLSEGPFALCMPPPENATPGRLGFTQGLCPNGQVAHWTERAEAARLGVEFDLDLSDGFSCMDPASCLFAETQLPATLRGRCLYQDYSVVVTGIIPPVATCGTLPERGLCAVNCRCTGEMEACIGLSESHPVGACGHIALPCLRSSGCRGYPSPTVCMFVTNIPDHFWESESVSPAGRCVSAESCTELQAETGDTWTCGPMVR
jgi:hypothetical protein